MKQGVIFIATGENSVNQAILAAKTIRQQCGDLGISIFTDLADKIDKQYFEHIIAIERKGGKPPLKTYDKVLNLINTPYEHTLFMDTDVFVMDDIREMYRLLEKFDIALGHDHNRISCYESFHNGGAVDKSTMPFAFATLQSGVILYRKNEKVWNFLRDYIRVYESKQYFYDQATLKELMWNNTEMRVWILPEEYNFDDADRIIRWKKLHYTTNPKIFHYYSYKNRNIEKLVARQLRRAARAIFWYRVQRKLNTWLQPFGLSI